jgi:hypothetical protein
MRTPGTRPSLLALGAGAVAGLLLAAALRATLLDGDQGRVPPRALDAIACAVAAAALVVSWLVRWPSGRRMRVAPGVLAVAGGMLGSLAIASYWGLGNDVNRYHVWDQFHYYMGGKYFAELGYSRIYACTAVAEAERVGPDEMAGRHMRNLTTDSVVPAEEALAYPERCTERFRPERWRAFGDDVMWFREATGPIWDRMQQDHGFNPPPSWVLAGGPLAHLGPASAGTLMLLSAVDYALLGLMLGIVWWAFGAHVLLVAMVVWGCQLPGQATWTTGAFLRQDWLVLVVAAACLARRGWPALSGAALASAAALRVFPALLVVLPLVVIVRRCWQRKRLGRFDARFLAGAAAAAVGWLAVTSAVFGTEVWSEYLRHLAAHRSAPAANQVGLRALLSQSWDGRWVVTRRPGEVDPFLVWGAMRRATFAANHTLYLTLAGVIAAVSACAAWRMRRLWTALAASAVVVVATVDLASYYYAFFIVLGLLAAASRVEEALALGAILVGRAADMLPIASENPDIRYTVQSGVFVAWAVAAAVMLAWRPAIGGRRTSR